MSGARAALRVENRVAVRVRALISTLSLNLEAVEPYSARARGVPEGGSRKTFSEGETRAVRRRMRFDLCELSETDFLPARFSITYSFVLPAAVARRNRFTASSPLTLARVATVDRSNSSAGTTRSESNPTLTPRRSRTGSPRVRNRRTRWVLCLRRRSSFPKRAEIVRDMLGEEAASFFSLFVF